MSLQARTTEYPFFMRSLATLAMVVVFPVPFIPTKRITYGSFTFFFLSTISHRSISWFVVRTSSRTSLRFFLTISFLSSSLLTWTPSSLFSISSQMWSATDIATSFPIRSSLKSSKIGRSFSVFSSVVVTLLRSPPRPFLSLSNTACSLPFTQFCCHPFQF